MKAIRAETCFEASFWFGARIEACKKKKKKFLELLLDLV